MVKIRVLLADDHSVMRDGLRLLIDGQPDMEVVGEAAMVADIVSQTVETNCDVAVVDITMPDGSGIDFIADIRAARPATRVLVLTMHEDPAHLRKALQAGAAGYVAKRVAGSQLLNAIRAVYDGRSYIEVPIMDTDLESAISDSSPPDSSPVSPSPDVLSPRELEVLKFVASGHTNQETAESLHLSVKTVEGYRSRLMHKLNLRSRSELVRYALRAGLLADEGSS